MNNVPEWRTAGDWFDICSCNIPCPCEFAQPPTNNACQGMLVWHIREGRFGDIRLDGFNLLALGAFEGNLWAGAKAKMGLFIDERADERQRQALQTIFGGQAGGWPAGFDMSPALFGTGKSARKSWFYFTENELTPGAARVGNYKAVVPGKVKRVDCNPSNRDRRRDNSR